MSTSEKPADKAVAEKRSPRASPSRGDNKSPSPSRRPAKQAKLTDVVKVLGELAPLELAASWDNVGLLVEPTTNDVIKHITCTIDLTESVLEGAIAAGSNLIVAYHPPVGFPFPLASLSSRLLACRSSLRSSAWAKGR